MANVRDALARTIQAEAGNQGVAGMIDVGSVIANRAATGGYGDGLLGVMMKPGQFSAWNSQTGYAGGEQGQNMGFTPNSTAYSVADKILSGDYTDRTGGATHYYAVIPGVSGQPKWHNDSFRQIDGDHYFGNADAGRGGDGRAYMQAQPQGQFSTQGAAPMARAQSPAGLLPMPQAPEQAGILGGILGDKVNSYLTPDRLARLQMGLEGMTLNPNQALMASAREGIQGRAKAREEARLEGRQVEQANKTIEWLNSQGMGDLANAVASGVLPIGQAFNAAQQAMSTPGVETTTLGDRLINKQTGEVIADFSTPDDDVQGAVRSLMQRAELGGLEPGTPEYETFMIQGGANKGMSFQVSPDGTVSLATGGADIKPLTEGQSSSATYATRAEGALPTLDEYDTALTSRLDRVKDADPTGFARGTQNKEYQLARQAGDEFLQAILRKDTGAAITEGEQALYGVTYLPQPGDSDELIAQKRQARKRALEAMKAGMSPAAMVAQEAALGRVDTPAASDWSGPSAQQVMQMTPEQATQYLSGVNVADLPEDVQDAILEVLE